MGPLWWTARYLLDMCYKVLPLLSAQWVRPEQLVYVVAECGEQEWFSCFISQEVISGDRQCVLEIKIWQSNCAWQGERIARHNSLRDVLHSAAVSAALAPTKEGRALLPGQGEMPADIFIPRWEALLLDRMVMRKGWHSKALPAAVSGNAVLMTNRCPANNLNFGNDIMWSPELSVPVMLIWSPLLFYLPRLTHKTLFQRKPGLMMANWPG